MLCIVAWYDPICLWPLPLTYVFARAPDKSHVCGHVMRLGCDVSPNAPEAEQGNHSSLDRFDTLPPVSLLDYTDNNQCLWT